MLPQTEQVRGAQASASPLQSTVGGSEGFAGEKTNIQMHLFCSLMYNLG